MKGTVIAAAGSLAALLIATAVAAADGPYKQVRGWSLYRNDTDCAAFMVFDNGEAVGFTYDAPGRSTKVTFSDGGATSFADGDTPSLDILLRRPDGTVDHAWESTVFLVAAGEDGPRTLTSRWLGPPALADFSNAAVVGFFDGDKEIGVFNLKGTAAALQEVERCSTQLADR